jgi:hypothetical protein
MPRHDVWRSGEHTEKPIVVFWQVAGPFGERAMNQRANEAHELGGATSNSVINRVTEMPVSANKGAGDPCHGLRCVLLHTVCRNCLHAVTHCYTVSNNGPDRLQAFLGNSSCSYQHGRVIDER